jgi:hypothetical protein
MSRRKDKDQERALLVYGQERTAEIHARIVSVERACKAIGYSPQSSYERLAAMIAKTCGHGVLTRPLKDIASDRDIQFSERQTKRAIEDLVDVGLLLQLDPPTPEFKKRGRPKRVFSLQINWPFVHEVVANEYAKTTPSDYSASSRREPGVSSASSRHLENHTALYSHNPKVPGSPSPLRPKTERKPVENQEDHSCDLVVPSERSCNAAKSRMTSDQVQATATRLFVGLDYFGGNASTLWMVAAAFDAGLIAEADIADSIRGAYECAGPSHRVAYFRTCLMNRLELDAAAMRALLSKVVIVGGAPDGPPASAIAAKAQRSGRRKLPIGYDANRKSEREISNASRSIIEQLAKEVLAK